MTFRVSGRLLAAAFAVLIALVGLPAAASAAPPPNDNFADAATLSVGDTISGSNLDATSETGEPTPSENGSDDQIIGSGCSSPDQTPSCASSVWYLFHAPDTANYTIATCDEGTDVDTILGVWTGASLGALTQVAANDQGTDCAGGDGTNGSLVTFDATAGTDYKIQLTGYQAARGSFWLRAYPTASPPASSNPDTAIARFGSYAGAFPLTGGVDFASGPRHSASFAFASDQDGASFECSLDGAGFAPCSSPVSYDVTGSHRFAVRAVVGGQPDPTPAVQRFTVDNTPPETSFVTAPPDPASDTDVNWTAATSEPSTNSFFFCASDGQPLTFSCGSRFGTGPFCTGIHKVETTAVDDAFNVDPTPAEASFDETGGDPCAAPTISVSSLSPPSRTLDRLQLAIDPRGEGGSVRLDWGTTTAYGNTSSEPVGPGPVNQEVDPAFLSPGTTYHYKATVTTPKGTSDTGDHTFTTATFGQPVPSLALGTPVVVGHHAAALPLTIDPHGASNLEYGILIDPAGDPTFDSRFLIAPDEVSGDGPLSRTIDLVDLDPGVTYHVRAIAIGNESAESAEATFPAVPGSGTVTPAPIPAIKAQQFKFRRSSIKLGKLSRHSRFLTLSVRNLPPFASVGLALNANVHSSSLKRLLHKQTRASKFGVAKFKVKLSKKARKLLRNRHVKSLSLTVTVRTSGQRPTHITLHPRLKR